MALREIIVLQQTRTILLQKGWGQHAHCVIEPPRSQMDPYPTDTLWDHPNACSFSLRGALLRAADDCLATDVLDELVRILPDDKWNDRPETTLADVLNALDDALARVVEREVDRQREAGETC